MKRIVFTMAIFLLGFNVYAGGGVNEISSATDFKAALSGGGVVVVDFFATWCGPCKTLGPILAGLAGEYSGKVTFLKVDVDKHQDLAKQYNIQSIPDVRIFKDNSEKEHIIGLRSKKDYQEKLDALIK